MLFLCSVLSVGHFCPVVCSLLRAILARVAKPLRMYSLLIIIHPKTRIILSCHRQIGTRREQSEGAWREKNVSDCLVCRLSTAGTARTRLSGKTVYVLLLNISFWRPGFGRPYRQGLLVQASHRVIVSHFPAMGRQFDLITLGCHRSHPVKGGHRSSCSKRTSRVFFA